MISNAKNLFLNIGAHLTVLGMIGILSIIFTGVFCYKIGLGANSYYSILFGLLSIAFVASIFCLKCNCSNFYKS